MARSWEEIAADYEGRGYDIPYVDYNPQANIAGLADPSTFPAGYDDQGNYAPSAPSPIFPPIFPTMPTTPAAAPRPVASSSGPTSTPPGSAAPDLNLPYGYQYVEPMLRFLLGMYGLQETQQSGAAQRSLTQGLADADRAQRERFFNVEGDRAAGDALARLQAAGPASAAELAFRRAGMGYSPFGANMIDAKRLLTSGTRDAGGTSSVRIGEDTVTVPNSLNFRQLQGAARDPFGAKLLTSLGQAATGTDLIQQTLAALPAGMFQGIAPAF